MIYRVETLSFENVMKNLKSFFMFELNRKAGHNGHPQGAEELEGWSFFAEKRS